MHRIITALRFLFFFFFVFLDFTCSSVFSNFLTAPCITNRRTHHAVRLLFHKSLKSQNHLSVPESAIVSVLVFILLSENHEDKSAGCKHYADTCNCKYTCCCCTCERESEVVVGFLVYKYKSAC